MEITLVGKKSSKVWTGRKFKWSRSTETELHPLPPTLRKLNRESTCKRSLKMSIPKSAPHPTIVETYRRSYRCSATSGISRQTVRTAPADDYCSFACITGQRSTDKIHFWGDYSSCRSRTTCPLPRSTGRCRLRADIVPLPSYNIELSEKYQVHDYRHYKHRWCRF